MIAPEIPTKETIYRWIFAAHEGQDPSPTPAEIAGLIALASRYWDIVGIHPNMHAYYESAR